MLLNSQLLELDELGATGLQIEAAPCLVDSAVLTWTHSKWHEGERVHLLNITKTVLRRKTKIWQTRVQMGGQLRTECEGVGWISLAEKRVWWSLMSVRGNELHMEFHQ